MISKMVEFIQEYEKQLNNGNDVTELSESKRLIENKLNLLSEIWRKYAPSLRTPLFIDHNKSTPFRHARDTALKETENFPQYPWNIN